MMTEMPGPIADVGCPCDRPGGCVCPKEERLLRAGGPFTEAQRQWCRNEILSVEGFFADLIDGVDDKTLGRTVLCAWVDYCRDKGLL